MCRHRPNVENVTAYNLTVDGIHTDYAGRTPVLVHNSCLSEAEGLRRQVPSQSQVAGPGAAFAGGGTGVPFRDAAAAAARYGGEAADYTKVASVDTYNVGSGIYDLFETYWIEDGEGQQFEFKTKFPRAEAYFASVPKGGTVTDDEVMARSVGIAREIVAGTRSGRAGAAEIWRLSSENGRACFGDLRGFIAAASQWDEVPDQRDALTDDVLRAALDLLSRYGA